MNDQPGKRRAGTIGLPMGLNMYELLPFWHALVYDVWALRWSFPRSPAAKLYIAGQHTIPSDTVCFPAKLMHGHVDYPASIRASRPSSTPA